MGDRFRNIKHIGYCWSQLPPEEAKLEFEDFIEHAKFQLCLKTNRLMKDPIWDTYNEAEILVEYYAHVFTKSEEERKKFLASLETGQGEIDDFLSWADDQIEKNKEEVKKIDELEDHISFKPSSIGDENDG